MGKTQRRLFQLSLQLQPSPVAAAEELCDGEAFTSAMLAKAPPGSKVNGSQIKMYGFVKRDEAKCSHEEFAKMWKDPHLPNVVGSGLNPQRYIVNLFDEPKNGKLAFDGCAQMWFASMEDHKAKFAATPGNPDPFTKAAGTAKADFCRVFAREYVFIDGPREGKKSIALLKPKPGVTRRAFLDHYFGVHAFDAKNAFAKALPADAKVRYSLSVVMDPARSEWGAVVELWAPDGKSHAAFQAAMPDVFKARTGVPRDDVWDSLRERGPGFVGEEVVGIA